MIVRPQLLEARCPDLTNGINETLVVSGAPGSVASLCQVVADEALEVIELPVGDENGGVRAVLLLADIKQLDTLALSSQTLECQLDIRKALELDLKSQPTLKSGILLGFPCVRGSGPQLVDLLQQSTAVLSSVLPRNWRPTAPASRPKGFGLGHSFQDEVPMSLVASIRHVEAESPLRRFLFVQLVGDGLTLLKHDADFGFFNLCAPMDQCIFQHFVRRTRDLGIVQPMPIRLTPTPTTCRAAMILLRNSHFLWQLYSSQTRPARSEPIERNSPRLIFFFFG